VKCALCGALRASRRTWELCDDRCPRQRRGSGTAAAQRTKTGDQRHALDRARPSIVCRFRRRHLGSQIRRAWETPERHQIHRTRQTNSRQVGVLLCITLMAGIISRLLLVCGTF